MRPARLLALAWLATGLSACAGKTRLDCIELCRSRGLRFEEKVTAVRGYDRAEQQLDVIDACRCR